MVDGFKIEVPITLKGGREGEKVGKQIGEKIATQIKKSFSAINVGGTKAGGIGPSGMLGVSKGLKGVATNLGVIGVAIGAAVGLLAKASPYLKGILSIFGRAFMIFFRPFGDFLATLLRPLAILLMKMAVAFLKWTRPITGKIREAVAEVPQFELVDNALANFAIGIANWALQLGAGIGAVVVEIAKAAFELGGKIGQWLYDQVILPAGTFIAGKMTELWEIIKSPFVWLAEQIRSFFAGFFGEGGGAGEPVTSATKGVGMPTGNIQNYLATGAGGGPVPAGGMPISINQNVSFSGNIEKDVDIDSLIKRAGKMVVNNLKSNWLIM